MWMNRQGHEPVMVEEALAALAPRPRGRYLDATFGGGGYSRALLDKAPALVVGLDRDPEAVARGRALEAEDARFRMIEGRFGAMRALLESAGIHDLDGIVLDLGISSYQLDDPERGFSFQKDGPLDMRMERSGPSAADLVNEADEATLARILRDYGEEPAARRIARAITRARRRAPIRRTRELAELVAGAIGRRPGTIDPATRSFQALRIAVNDELGELERALHDAESLLVPGGRLVMVSFHSLEDRIVKRFLRERSGRTPAPSRHAPPAPRPPARFRLLTTSARRPSAAEVARNPRARSARLRAAIRLADEDEATTWQGGLAA